jgi:protein-tyrosine-phosphatase
MKQQITLLLFACVAAACLAESTRTVIFVCEKGSVKSVLAAAQFNRMAREKNLEFTAMPRGTRADEVVPEKLVQSMKADGLEAGLATSRKLTVEEVRSAVIVVSMCDLPADLSKDARVESWPDIPPVSVDYAKARDTLAARIDKLAATLAVKP